MENRPPGPDHEQFRFGDSDHKPDKDSPKQSRELRLPRVPLSGPEHRPASAAEANKPSFDIAEVFRQHEAARMAEEARRTAEAVARQQENDDDGESEEGDTPATVRPEVPAAGAQDAASELNHATAVVDKVEADVVKPPAEAADAALHGQAPAESGSAAAAEAAQPTASSSREKRSVVAPENEESPPVDPAALEQLLQEAEAYANEQLADGELAPAPDGAEPDGAAPEVAASEAAAEAMPIPDDAEDDESGTVAAAAGATSAGSGGAAGATPRQRIGSGASGAAPFAPPPLVPIPLPGGAGSAGRGVPVRPRSGGGSGSAATPSSDGGSSASGLTRGYGDGGGSAGGGGSFGPPVPGMGPTGPNVLNAGANLAGNIAGNALHSHEHWHPKTFLALAGAILVSHMLGKRRDRMITREMRERTDRLGKIIEQNNAQLEQQQAKLRREAAAMQESYDESRRAFAARLEQVESQQQASQAAEQRSAVQAAEQRARAQAAEAAAAVPAGAVGASESRMAQSRSAVPVGPAVGGERGHGLSGQRVAPVERSGTVPAVNTFESGSDRTVLPELAPDTQRYAELNARPNMVAEQVAQAAELGVSTEKAYERSHEVRDEQGAGGGQQGGGAAAGSVFDTGAGYQPQQAVSRQLADAQAQLSQGQSYQRPDGDMYRKAMQAGFWGGVVVIVLAILAAFAL